MLRGKYIVWCLLVILLPCCTPFTYTYTNPLPNDPAFTQTKQAKAGGQIGYTASHIQGAVSPIRHLAVVGGASVGYAGQQGYSIGGQLYAPAAQWKGGRLYGAVTLFAEGGQMNRLLKSENFYSDGTRSFDIRMHYTGLNIQTSVYYVSKRENGDKFKLGITLKRSEISYTNLYFKEQQTKDTSTTTTFFTDVENATFNGYSGWGYFMYESSNDRFYVISQIGLMYNGNVAQLAANSNSSYYFKYTPLFTGTFGIRLWNR